jgi:hypothetical protein
VSIAVQLSALIEIGPRRFVPSSSGCATRGDVPLVLPSEPSPNLIRRDAAWVGFANDRGR